MKTSQRKDGKDGGSSEEDKRRSRRVAADADSASAISDPVE